MYPTMVYIHGGGFRFGTSHGRDCGALSISGEVIIVIINFRLKVFGQVIQTALETLAFGICKWQLDGFVIISMRLVEM